MIKQFRKRASEGELAVVLVAIKLYKATIHFLLKYKTTIVNEGLKKLLMVCALGMQYASFKLFLKAVILLNELLNQFKELSSSKFKQPYGVFSTK